MTKSWLGHKKMQLNVIKYRKRKIKEEKFKWLFDCELCNRYSSEKLHFASVCEKKWHFNLHFSEDHVFLARLFSRV